MRSFSKVIERLSSEQPWVANISPALLPSESFPHRGGPGTHQFDVPHRLSMAKEYWGYIRNASLIGWRPKSHSEWLAYNIAGGRAAFTSWNFKSSEFLDAEEIYVIIVCLQEFMGDIKVDFGGQTVLVNGQPKTFFESHFGEYNTLECTDPNFVQWSDGCTDNPRKYTTFTPFAPLYGQAAPQAVTSLVPLTSATTAVTLQLFNTKVSIDGTEYTTSQVVQLTDGAHNFQFTPTLGALRSYIRDGNEVVADASIVYPMDIRKATTIQAFSGSQLTCNVVNGTILINGEPVPTTSPENVVVLPNNTWYTIECVPDEGYKFVRWEEDASEENPRELMLNEGDITWTATTVPSDSAEITIEPDDGTPGTAIDHWEIDGVIYVDPIVLAKGVHTIQVFPAGGYEFQEWTDYYTQVKYNSNPVEFNLTQETLLKCKMAYPSTRVTCTADPNHGKFLINNVEQSTVMLVPGTTATIQFVPTDTYVLERWSGGATGSKNPLSITVPESDVSFIAHLVDSATTIKLHAVDPTLASGGGLVQVDSGTPALDVEVQVAKGTSHTLTAYPDTNWSFKKWSDNVVTNPRDVIISTNIELSAIFTRRVPFTVLCSNSHAVSQLTWTEEGSVKSATTTANVPVGTTVHVDVVCTPSGGQDWGVESWSDGFSTRDDSDWTLEHRDVLVDSITGLTLTATIKEAYWVDVTEHLDDPTHTLCEQGGTVYCTVNSETERRWDI